jgi:hypothetical protein
MVLKKGRPVGLFSHTHNLLIKLPLQAWLPSLRMWASPPAALAAAMAAEVAWSRQAAGTALASPKEYQHLFCY